MTSQDPRIEALVDQYLERRIDRRRFLQRAVGLGVSFGAASAFLAACGGDEEDAGDATSTAPTASMSTEQLNLRILNDIANLDPASWASAADDQVLACIMEGLVTLNPGTEEVVNQLAETFEPSEDGLRFDFKLKEGVLFHGDYGEVTAEDVKFSYERIAGLTEPALESPYQGDWAALDRVEVTGTYTGTIVLKEPFAPLMTSTLPRSSGRVVSKRAVEERGEDYVTQPIGTGPYEFVDWTPKREVTLRLFDDWGGASLDFAENPQWSEIRFVPIDDQGAADIAVETGDVDFGEISTSSVDRFEESDDLEVVVQSTFDYGWIGMNVQHEKLSDLRVREAIRYAVDVSSILEAAFEGKVTRANALIAPGLVGHWADAPQYEQDLERSRSLLSEAGVDSLDLTFTYAEEPGASAVAEIVQANLAEVGVNVEIIVKDSSELYELGDVIEELQLFYISFSNEPDPSWATVWFTCDQVRAWNWMSWCNEDYDRLHAEALLETDRARRDEMYIQMQELWDADIPSIFTHYRTKFFAHRPEVRPSIELSGRFTAWNFRT